MKITKEHYTHLHNTIQERIEKLGGVVIYEYREKLKNDKRVKNLETRFNWDMFYACKLAGYACNYLYTYLNDNHIDTALKSIMRDIKTTNPNCGL
jgi:hypothetical protein